MDLAAGHGQEDAQGRLGSLGIDAPENEGVVDPSKQLEFQRDLVRSRMTQGDGGLEFAGCSVEVAANFGQVAQLQSRFALVAPQFSRLEVSLGGAAVEARFLQGVTLLNPGAGLGRLHAGDLAAIGQIQRPISLGARLLRLTFQLLCRLATAHQRRA